MSTHNIPLLGVERVIGQAVGLCIVPVCGQVFCLLQGKAADLLKTTLGSAVACLLDGSVYLEKNNIKIQFGTRH